MKLKWLSIFVLFAFCLGCQTQLAQFKPSPTDEGELALYMQPFPREASRLGFELDGIAVLTAAGAELPLGMKLTDYDAGSVGRQRLAASGRLPRGAYRGLVFRVRKASLKSDEGESALAVPEQPQRVEFPFEMRRGRSLLLTMSLKYADAVGSAGFTPAFAVNDPAMPLLDLAGYVTNYASGSVTVFDKRSGQAMDLIKTGAGPCGIVLDQRQRRAYVAVSGEDRVEVVDLLLNEVVNSISLNPGDYPRELALTQDGLRLVTVNEGSNTASIIDTAALLEVARVRVGERPLSVLIDRGGTRAYVFNTVSNSISIVDLPNGTLVGETATEPGPLRGQLNRRGDRLLVFYSWSPYLNVYDVATMAVVKRIYVGMGTAFVKVDGNTDRFYLSRLNYPMIDIYDPFTMIPGDFLKTEGGASYMLIDGTENNLLLLQPEKGTLQIVNLVSKKTHSLLDVGPTPYWVAIAGER